MDNIKSVVSNTVYSKDNNLINSIQLDGIKINNVLNSFPDVIKEDKFRGFYANQLKRLGIERFTELVNKARKASDTPQRLFCWMLTHDTQVK